MRMWPYQMLDVLPRAYLLSQWRECLAIGGMLGSGNLNHATINRVKDYPIEHFHVYCDLVRKEFKNRGYTIGTNTLEKLETNIGYGNKEYIVLESEKLKDIDYVGTKVISIDGGNNFVNLLDNFHNLRYLKQCLYMFQEKYDVGMLTEEEWKLITNKFNFLI